MLAQLRERYAREFADIPERQRPKAKAYVARAAYYKATDEDREAYIQNWIRRDRNAAAVRMGKRTRKAKPAAPTPTLPPLIEGDDEEFVENELAENEPEGAAPEPPSQAEATSATRSIHFAGVANPLRSQASHATEKLNTLVEKTESSLMRHAVDPQTRQAARKLVAAMRLQVRRLTQETRKQARNLERAAKAEARKAYGRRHGATRRVGRQQQPVVNAFNSYED